MFFNRRAGVVGWLGLPFMLFGECLAPIVEVAGYLYMVVGWYLGYVSPTVMLLFLVVAIGLGTLLSLMGLLLEELSFKVYSRSKEVLVLFAAAMLENFGYRQLIAGSGSVASLQWLFGVRGRWGDMQRSAPWRSANAEPAAVEIEDRAAARTGVNPSNESQRKVIRSRRLTMISATLKPARAAGVSTIFGLLAVLLLSAPSAALASTPAAVISPLFVASAAPDDAFDEARRLAFAGEREAARALCREILAAKPSHHDARVLLGRVHAWDRQYDEAREQFLIVLRAKPDFADARVALVDTELWADNPGGALDALVDGLRRQPNSEKFLLRKARAERDLGRLSDAAVTSTSCCGESWRCGCCQAHGERAPGRHAQQSFADVRLHRHRLLLESVAPGIVRSRTSHEQGLGDRARQLRQPVSRGHGTVRD